MIVQIELEYLVCSACGTPFAISKSLYGQLRKDGSVFHCPNGHRQVFTEPLEEQYEKKLQEEGDKWANRLEREEDEHQACNDEYNELKKQLASTRALLTKERNKHKKEEENVQDSDDGK